MKYLLDTCIISEAVRPQPSKKVVKWIKMHDESSLFISVIMFGELYKGIEKLPDSKRKKELQIWIANELKERFWNRILDIDIKTAMQWGKIQGEAQRCGRPLPAVDSLIAATGLAHNLTVVTRNTSDMAASGVLLCNPWEA